jgi:DNA-binding IclR family transcriptional regulator
MTEGPVIESVDRALRLLQVLGARGAGATLEDVAAAAGLPKSSAHRTLAALRERRFAVQQEDGRYRVGPELLRVAFDFYERMDLRVALRPVLDRLHREVNETVHLGVLDGGDVVYLDKLEPSHPIGLTSRIGGRNPAHCTGVGKALLAWTYPTDEAILGWIAERGTLEARTATSITSPDALAQEMARIRADGYARDMEESEQGVRCLAAPLFLGGARPRAAVSIAAPRERLSAARMRALAPVLLRTISAFLGPVAAPGRGDGLDDAGTDSENGARIRTPFR